MNDDGPLPYAFPIRVLFVLCLFLFVFLPMFVYGEYRMHFPGRIPLVLWYLPSGILACLLFVLGCKILRRFGVAIRKDEVKNQGKDHSDL